MIPKGSAHYGEIYWVDFDPSVGHEYKNRRPALIVQSEEELKKSNVVTVIPFTSNLQKKKPMDILVHKNHCNHLFTDSILKVQCIMSFDYSRFVRKIGEADRELLEAVKKYLKTHFSL